MKVIKLGSTHVDAVRPLFKLPKFMGVSPEQTHYVDNKEVMFDEFYHDAFVTTYLTGLKNYHAYGALDNQGIVQSYIGFYESTDDASWYWNQVRSFGNNLIKPVLDSVIQHNEELGRLKFYSMFPVKFINVYRRLAFSKYNKERYDYFDEFLVPEKNQCIYTLPWQIVYTRTLSPVDTVVRCTFLKQKYRTTLPIGGNI